jgi:transposase
VAFDSDFLGEIELRSGMSRTFREWNPDQSWLFPPSPQDWLPDGHLVYFLMDVSEQLDLSPIMKKYDSEKGGKPPYHPRMMLVLLLYSYCIGVFSSRKIVARCETDVAFRVIVGDNIPDFRTISEYRRRHLEQFQNLFVEVLRLCRESGLLKVGRLALDGTKIKANASRHKAMSYDRMLAEEKRLQAEIDELLKQAQAADDAEDAELGRDHRGDELPDELRRRESRLLKIREAKAALEQQARDKAAAEAAIREAEGKPPAKTDPQDAVPDPKAQRNFTDPESKIMKTSSKGWDQCGNAQAVVNENQIIVAADVTDQANDVRQVQPMLDQTITNINQAGVTENIKAFTADAGYFSEANVEVLEQHERVDEAYIATGRLKHHERVAPAPTGRIPAGLSVKEKMARKLRTKKGRAEYARRKAMAEPPFGQIKHCRGFRQFLLRSMEKMKAEWNLVTLTHNLLKLFRSGALATH